MTAVQQRMAQEVDRIRHDHDGQTIALVSHCDPLRSLLAQYLDLSLDRMLRFEISPASVSIVHWYGSSPSVYSINENGGLAE